MKTRFMLYILFAVLALSGCRRGVGYGVVVWASEEDSPENGTVVKILERSNLRGTFLIRPLKAKRNYELKAWQVEFFENRDEAVAFRDEFASDVNTWAVCGRHGLPVRESYDANSRKVYKLANGETVKVLGRGADKVQVGNLEGYWYRILTKDGTRGWCFDRYLDVFEMQDGQKIHSGGGKTVKTGAEELFDVTWRPELYQTRIRLGQVDTSLFKADYKLVFDEKQKKIIMQAPKRKWEREFESVVEGRPGQYTFVGANFMVTINGPGFITVQFSQDGSDIAEPWVILEKDPALIVEEENKRRSDTYKSIFNYGPVLQSSRFGTITLQSDGSFQWTGKERLISSRILTSGAGSGGKISLDIFCGEELGGRYQGALMFRFSGGENAVFLYRFVGAELELVWADPKYIEDKVVKSDFSVENIKINFRSSRPEPDAAGDGEPPADDSGDSQPAD